MPLARLSAKFCQECGQETTAHPPTFWEFVHEFITHYVALEGKLWRTLGMLFFKPAELTREYRAGRKIRYISPLRLYITASFLFFLFVKVFGWGQLVHIETTPGGPKKTSGISFSTTAPEGKNYAEMSSEELGKSAITVNDFECDGAAGTWCHELRSRLLKKYEGKTGHDMWNTMKAGMIANVPYALFLLLPFYALLTKVLYRSRGLYFGEHMVYALHIHAFTFFVLLLKAALPRFLGDAVLLLAWVYYFMAMQRYFGGRWWATTLRYFMLGTIYFLAIVLMTWIVLALVLLV